MDHLQKVQVLPEYGLFSKCLSYVRQWNKYKIRSGQAALQAKD